MNLQAFFLLQRDGQICVCALGFIYSVFTALEADRQPQWGRIGAVPRDLYLIRACGAVIASLLFNSADGTIKC